MLALLTLVLCSAWLFHLSRKVGRLEEQVHALSFAGPRPVPPPAYDYPPEPVVEPPVGEVAPEPIAPIWLGHPAEIAPPRVEPIAEDISADVEEPVRAPRRSVFEDLFGGRLPIWAGGVTLAVAAVFLVRYSIENGILPPIARVSAGLVFAIALVGGGEITRRLRATADDRRISQALAGAGIASAYVSILAAIRLYDLIAPLPGFMALAVVTGAAMLLALRFGAPCAVLGLVGGLAAPALVGATEPNVPGMAFYLMLVIGGLGEVARRQRWLWLSASALVGGFGWAALLMLDVIDSVSGSATGVLLLALAFVLPVFAKSMARGGLVRMASLAIGSIEIAMLVARGGYAPLEWGFYGLLGIGSVVLARLDPRQRAMPPVALAVALGTIFVWPAPTPGLLVAVLAGVVAIFAALALIEARHAARGKIGALQGAAALCLVPLIAWIKLPVLLSDMGWAILCIGFAAAAGVAAASVWKSLDERFAALASAASLLVTAAAIWALPLGALPPAFAAIACIGLWVAGQSEDNRFAWTSRLIGLLIPPAILLHMIAERTTFWIDLGLIAAALIVACAGHVERGMRFAAVWLVAAASIAGLALHDQLAPALLPGCLAGFAALLVLVPRTGRLRPLPSALTFAGLVAILVVEQMARWLQVEAPALFGASVDVAALSGIADAMLRLAVPGALLAFIVARVAPTGEIRKSLLLAPAAAVAIALHILYRHGVAQVGMSGGAPERILLTTLLLGAGVAVYAAQSGSDWRKMALGLLALGVARTLWFEMIVCNPLLTVQAIGALPILNWLVPAYLLPAVLLLRARQDPMIARMRRPIDIVVMLVVLQFVAASVRQLFHGAILTGADATSGEDVMRSLAGIATAIGFLLYGLKGGGKDWRIAGLVLMIATVLKVFLVDAAGLDGLLRILSFVALGLSLIGIGWLHKRLSAPSLA
jgi:uncharacterized membrane protein